jgi:hypothetical protein
MGLLDSLNEMRSCLSGRENSIDALSDNLYLLLNRDKIQKLSAMKLNGPGGRTSVRGLIDLCFVNRKACIEHREGI